MFVYTNSDRPIKDDNTCERAALRTLQQTPTDLVKLPRECSLLTWYPIPDPNSSETQVRVLARWKVVPETKRYYQDAQQRQIPA